MTEDLIEIINSMENEARLLREDTMESLRGSFANERVANSLERYAERLRQCSEML